MVATNNTQQKPGIQINAQQQFQVRGELRFSTILPLWQEGEQMIKNHAQSVFDFSGVSYIDSSSLALLTAWIKKAQQLNRPIKFLNVPTKLHTIAKLSGFDKVIDRWIN